MTLKDLVDVSVCVDYVVLDNVEYHSFCGKFISDDKSKKILSNDFNKYLVTSINCCVESIDWDIEEAVMYVNIKEN